MEADSPVSVRQNPPTAQRIFSALLSARAAMGVLLTISGYFVGTMYYSRYLARFHLDNQLFPLDASGNFVMGAIAVFRLSTYILHSLNTHPFLSLLGALGSVLYIMCLAIIFSTKPRTSLAPEKSSKMRQQMRDLWTTKHWLRAGAKGALIAGLTVYATFAFLLTVIFIIAVPAIIGQTAADLAYDEAVKAYAGGCEKPGKAVCLRLDQDNKPAVEGFLIAASPDQIALYSSGTVSVVPMKGNRLVSLGFSPKR